MHIVIIPTHRPSDWQNIQANIKRQKHQPDAVIIVENGEDSDWTHGLSEAIRLTIGKVDVGEARNAGLEACKSRFPGSFFSMLDGDDYYGPEYLAEAWENRNKAIIIGKHRVFYRFASTDTLCFSEGYENEPASIVHGPTMSGHTDAALPFLKCPGWGEDMEWQRRMMASGATIFATSRHHFCGYRNTDMNYHTWYMPDIAVGRSMKMTQEIQGTNWQNIVNGQIDPVFIGSPKLSFNTPDL